MNPGRGFTALCAILLAACAGAAPPRPSSTAQALNVTNGARAFMAAVADGITRRGPAAWRDYFADTPAFFMAVDGHLAFATSDAATRGIQEVTKSIPRIELQWGDVRVDPLTSTLAMVAAPYHELQTDAGGNQRSVDGYFTALAELGPGGWRFRNAHWSTAMAPK